MAEKDKGFSFKKLFLRETEEEQNAQAIPSGRTSITGQMQETSQIPVSQSLTQEFVKRLQNLINQNNQAGFDFLEFTESLFEERQNPDPEVYKTVFRIAQRMDKSLTPAKLLESSMYYKNLVQNTADSEIVKGEQKKQEIQTAKENDKTNLDNNLKTTKNQIQQLTRQIQDLQTLETNLTTEILAIDQKYAGKFTEIDNKISAIRNAKEQVLVSIVDIEAGIKSNLS